MATKIYLFEEDFIDFDLIGISSKYSDSVQFVYNLNLHFQTKFHRIDDLDVLVGEHSFYYPVYEWQDKETQVDYHIIKNSAYTIKPKQENANLSLLFEVAPLLIPKHKEYNFFLRINPENDKQLPIKENEFIQKITKLDTSKIKNITSLVF